MSKLDPDPTMRTWVITVQARNLRYLRRALDDIGDVIKRDDDLPCAGGGGPGDYRYVIDEEAKGHA